MRKVQRCDQRIENIFPHWFTWTAMRQSKRAEYKRRRQCIKIGDILRLECFLCPVNSLTGIGIKSTNIQATQCGPVMISSQTQVRQCLEEFDTFVRVRAITYDIAQAPDVIQRALCIRLDGFKGS